MIHGNGKNIITIDSSIKFKILKYKIEILNYIESAVKAGDKYYFNNEPGACPAAHVNVTFEDGHQIQAWLSCGSYNRQFESLKLDSQNSLVMLFPEPKLFVSEIQLFNKKGDITNAKLEVNKPFDYDQFKIYQLSYDSNLGKWSDTSVIELIYDPWLPYVYIGIFLMIIGAIYMLFTGAVKKK